MFTDEILCKQLTRIADAAEKIANALEQLNFYGDLPKPSDPNKLISEREASELLGASIAWFQRKRVYGDGPPYIKVGSLVRYRISDLEKWCRLNRSGSTSERDPKKSRG